MDRMPGAETFAGHRQQIIQDIWRQGPAGREVPAGPFFCDFTNFTYFEHNLNTAPV